MGNAKVQEWNALRDRAFTNWNELGRKPLHPPAPEPASRQQPTRKPDDHEGAAQPDRDQSA